MTVNPYDCPESREAMVKPAPIPVRAKGMLTAEDARQALNVVFRQGSGIVLIVTAITVVILLAAAALLAYRNSGHEFEFWTHAAALPIVGSFFVPMYFVHRRRFTRTWNSRSENQQPVTWTFRQDGLLIETANGKQLQFWNSFIYALTTNDKLILAQQGGMQFNFVPRRFFETEEDWAAVCPLLAAKLPMRDHRSR